MVGEEKVNKTQVRKQKNWKKRKNSRKIARPKPTTTTKKDCFSFRTTFHSVWL